MKDRSIVVMFATSIIVLAVIILLLGIFVRPKILDIGTPMFVANLNKNTKPSPKSNFAVYPEVNGDKFIVRFTNVICDGAMDPDTRENAIFRLSFVLESDNNYLHKHIPENEQKIINIVRNIMERKSVADMTGEQRLDQFKQEVKRDINKFLPDTKVSDVYLEGLIGR